jgi:hypothetical protein
VAFLQFATNHPLTASGRRRRFFSLLAAVALGWLAPIGCSRNTVPAGAGTTDSRAVQRQARKAARTNEEAWREDLEQIPPPSKNRYLSVRSRDAYSNPFLVVHPSTVTLTIIYPDQNPNGFGSGGLLRPAAARKEELEVRLSDLPKALASLPAEVWPYGRVIAIEESVAAPRAERVAIRRNVEATIQVLNDLGIVVDEWTGSNGALLR